MGNTVFQSISLYYREGSSDKVYHVQLEQVADGFVVNFQFGRRGSTLQAGTKTPVSVGRVQAEKIYSKLVAEKKGKGYTEGESGTPYSGTSPEKQASGYLPQLANFIEEPVALALLDNDEWGMQNKVDGVRQIVMRSGNSVTAANRKGLVVPIASSIEQAVLSVQTRDEADFVLDGEAIGDTYVAFDVLRFGGMDLCTTPLKARLEVLHALTGTTMHGSLEKIETAYTSEAKHELFARLQSDKAEGVVFKRLDAGYTVGRPAAGGDALKFKFYATATFGVIAVNDKRSVQLGAASPRGWQFVGNVTIPANQEIPAPLSLVEVRYLYRYPEGSLYQPTYLGPRADKDIPDDLATLKIKPTPGEQE
jgi:bifunctional non-homologous end joining protein LigD